MSATRLPQSRYLLARDRRMIVAWLLLGCCAAATRPLRGGYMAVAWLSRGRYMAVTWLLQATRHQSELTVRLDAAVAEAKAEGQAALSMAEAALRGKWAQEKASALEEATRAVEVTGA